MDSGLNEFPLHYSMFLKGHTLQVKSFDMSMFLAARSLCTYDFSDK